MKNKIQIEKLIRKYIELDVGFHIEDHLSLILICNRPAIYISRRSLKHFVERRRVELFKNNGFSETIDLLFSMIMYIEKAVKDSDLITIKEFENKIIYEKVYKPENNLSIRVITEVVENHQEIKSLHFVKIKKPP